MSSIHSLQLKTIYDNIGLQKTARKAVVATVLHITEMKSRKESSLGSGGSLHHST
jgi:hypothetical protein